MNEKIARQIKEMKKQTIGVEVEMNNITKNGKGLKIKYQNLYQKTIF